MNYIVNFIFFLFFLSFTSCNESTLEKFNKELDNHYGDSLVTDIPEAMESNSFSYKLWRKLSASTGLPLIDTGFNKLQIRIWERFDDLTGQLVILKNLNNNWSAELYRYKYVTSSGYILDSLPGEKYPLKEPLSGWEVFMDKLLKLEILTLPDFREVPGYNINTDETAVTVEIAKKRYYRIYEYFDVYQRKDKYPEVKKIVQILELVKDEFSLDKE